MPSTPAGLDGVDDELRPLDGRGPVAFGGDRAVGDDVSFIHLSFLVVDGAVVVGAVDCPEKRPLGRRSSTMRHSSWRSRK